MADGNQPIVQYPGNCPVQVVMDVADKKPVALRNHDTGEVIALSDIVGDRPFKSLPGVTCDIPFGETNVTIHYKHLELHDQMFGRGKEVEVTREFVLHRDKGKEDPKIQRIPVVIGDAKIGVGLTGQEDSDIPPSRVPNVPVGLPIFKSVDHLLNAVERINERDPKALRSGAWDDAIQREVKASDNDDVARVGGRPAYVTEPSIRRVLPTMQPTPAPTGPIIGLKGFAAAFARVGGNQWLRLRKPGVAPNETDPEKLLDKTEVEKLFDHLMERCGLLGSTVRKAGPDQFGGLYQAFQTMAAHVLVAGLGDVNRTASEAEKLAEAFGKANITATGWQALSDAQFKAFKEGIASLDGREWSKLKDASVDSNVADPMELLNKTEVKALFQSIIERHCKLNGTLVLNASLDGHYDGIFHSFMKLAAKVIAIGHAEGYADVNAMESQAKQLAPSIKRVPNPKAPAIPRSNDAASIRSVSKNDTIPVVLPPGIGEFAATAPQQVASPQKTVAPVIKTATPPKRAAADLLQAASITRAAPPPADALLAKLRITRKPLVATATNGQVTAAAPVDAKSQVDAGTTVSDGAKKVEIPGLERGGNNYGDSFG